MTALDLATAEALLDCRAGASRAQVQSAYRRAVKRHRPDLGGVDGRWVGRVQAARDLLYEHAAADRRRRPRRTDVPLSQVLPLRRSTWGLADPEGPSLNLDL